MVARRKDGDDEAPLTCEVEGVPGGRAAGGRRAALGEEEWVVVVVTTVRWYSGPERGGGGGGGVVGMGRGVGASSVDPKTALVSASRPPSRTSD